MRDSRRPDLSAVTFHTFMRALYRTSDITQHTTPPHITHVQACTNLDVDIVCLELSSRMAMKLRPPAVKAALRRGVHFEVGGRAGMERVCGPGSRLWVQRRGLVGWVFDLWREASEWRQLMLIRCWVQLCGAACRRPTCLRRHCPRHQLCRCRRRHRRHCRSATPPACARSRHGATCSATLRRWCAPLEAG